ncbi:amino acid ABC transporter permease [Aggregatilinea lenta]|uniref:amino acid ABC transporter permease n=1 Tax=Aggregatilinea lenta TaxID=913108 RepID=UPI000E5BA63D|nr:ABC transporter permease subunit [Aggregatilinea lenta]
MAEPTPSRLTPSAHAPVPFWRDIRVIQIFLQIVFVVLVVAFFYLLINNLVTGLERSNLPIDFGILTRPFGTQISEGQMDFNPGKSSNLQALWAGLQNTLRVVSVGLIGATILGILVGVGRLATNALIRSVSSVYIEIFRNTPLLVQLYFIYRGMRLVLPETLRDSIQLPGSVYLNRRAVNFPLVQGTDTVWILWIALAVGLAVGIGLWVWRLRVQERTGQPANVLYWFIPSVLVTGLVGWLLSGGPLDVQTPELQGFNFSGGDRLSAEYLALTIGLILYTAAFIADIVRAGIQAVQYGQIEAARAQGLTQAQTLRLIVLPQALRLIIPPLGNQYLNLAKNSSLGIAIGFFDTYNIANVIANQTGQSVTLFASMMAIYLTMSLVISLVMNLVNYFMRLRER